MITMEHPTMASIYKCTVDIIYGLALTGMFVSMSAEVPERDIDSD